MVIYLYGTDRSQFTCYFLRFNIFHYIFLKYKIANILKLNIFIFVANIFIINIYINIKKKILLKNLNFSIYKFFYRKYKKIILERILNLIK